MKLTTLIPEGGPLKQPGDYSVIDRPDRKLIYFLCPGCGSMLGVQRYQVDDEQNPGKMKWVGWETVDLENLSARQSILHVKPDGCGWHGWLTKGELHVEHRPL